jgi:hypothetical protein
MYDSIVLEIVKSFSSPSESGQDPKKFGLSGSVEKSPAPLKFIGIIS